MPEVTITDKCVMWLCPRKHMRDSHYCRQCAPSPLNVHKQQRRSDADQAKLRARVVELRGQGMSLREIGRELDIYQSSVRRALAYVAKHG